jgi:hypothetical protein
MNIPIITTVDLYGCIVLFDFCKIMMAYMLITTDSEPGFYIFALQILNI